MRHRGTTPIKTALELLDHRLAVYSTEQRMVLGANTYLPLDLSESEEEPSCLHPSIHPSMHHPVPEPGVR